MLYCLHFRVMYKCKVVWLVVEVRTHVFVGVLVACNRDKKVTSICIIGSGIRVSFGGHGVVASMVG